jgi:hypothetical protein
VKGGSTTRDGLVQGIIGRDGELRWLAGRLGEVIADGAATIIVGGEPGIGKTSLVSAFVERSPELQLVGVGRFRTQDVEPSPACGRPSPVSSASGAGAEAELACRLSSSRM